MFHVEHLRQMKDGAVLAEKRICAHDHPVCARIGGLRPHFFTGAATPPASGGEYLICKAGFYRCATPLLAKRMRRGGCAIKIDPHSFVGADGVVPFAADLKRKPPRPRLQRMPRPPHVMRFGLCTKSHGTGRLPSLPRRAAAKRRVVCPSNATHLGNYPGAARHPSLKRRGIIASQRLLQSLRFAGRGVARLNEQPVSRPTAFKRGARFRSLPKTFHVEHFFVFNIECAL